MTPEKTRELIKKTVGEEVLYKLDLIKGKENVTGLNDLKILFEKICINEYTAITSDGKRQEYRDPDLDFYSKEAYAKGEHEFYCKPKNSNNPHGKLIKCEPQYKYRLLRNLTEVEYKNLFN